MEMKGVPIEAKVNKPGWQQRLFAKSVPEEVKQVDLLLTINFNEQWQDLRVGRVKFGLRGGELRLEIANGRIPYDARELASSLPFTIKKEREEKASRKAQTGTKASGSLSLPFTSSKAAAETRSTQEQLAETTDRFQLTDCQMTTKGAEDHPAWVFAVKTGETVLKGLLKQAKLGTLEIDAQPCQIDATFTLSKQDICLTSVDGIWPADINHNKRAWIERRIVLWMLESKLKPYLSRQTLQFPAIEGAEP